MKDSKKEEVEVEVQSEATQEEKDQADEEQRKKYDVSPVGFH
jgi:hypothetical protein